MKTIRWIKIFLMSGILLLSFFRTASAQQQYEQSEQTYLQQENPPLRSDEYPPAQNLIQYPYYDPETKLNTNQFPYYDSSTGFFIPGALDKQDPNWPVDSSVVNKFPYYDASSQFFIYGPLETADPDMPIPDPDAMPAPIQYAPPNTDGWKVNQPELNVSAPNAANPRLPVPNIAEPNIDIRGY